MIVKLAAKNVAWMGHWLRGMALTNSVNAVLIYHRPVDICVQLTSLLTVHVL